MRIPKENLLVITHIMYKNGGATEGPYTTVLRSLADLFYTVELVGIPLSGFEGFVLHGTYGNERKLYLPLWLGEISLLKYAVDTFIICTLSLKFLIKHRGDRNTIIGIDPLSALPLAFLRRIFGFKLVFYSVDFNEERFENPLLQKAYEFADKYSSKAADKVWVVCDALKNYKEQNYNTACTYVPNSFPFDSSYYESNKSGRTFNKFVWTGSVLTDKQVTDIVKVCKAISELAQDTEFVLVPVNRIEQFKTEVEAQVLKNVKILEVVGQEASRQIVSKCDVGLAIYDKDFGSTKFIEPIKIWEYMMCGLPFIISCEPSTNEKAVKENVAFLLEPDNKVPKSNSRTALFLDRENIRNVRAKAVEIAKEYDAKVIVKKSL